LLVDPDQRTTIMAWTTEDRRRYAPAMQEMVRRGMLVRVAATIDAIDPPASVGRPRIWPTLAMLRALWHIARDDRAWRRLPPGSPPHQTVWSRLQTWRRRAVLDRALGVLVACRRLAAGRKRRPTAAIIDTQSVKTGPQRGPRGYDANKKIKGRKRVLMIDTQGDPLGVQVVSADVQDRDALRALAEDLDRYPSLVLVWLDRAFAGDDPAAFLRAYGIIPELVGTLGRKGFHVEPRRWKVEQTFGCLQRYRRLRVDDETNDDTARQMTLLAAVFMIGMRLQRALPS
jgi:putative transposase